MCQFNSPTMKSFIVFVLLNACAVYSKGHHGGDGAVSEDLARIVGDLQNQVLALREARSEDQATIFKLQRKLQNHFDGLSEESFVTASKVSYEKTTTTTPLIVTAFDTDAVAKYVTQGDVLSENFGNSDTRNSEAALKEEFNIDNKDVKSSFVLGLLESGRQNLHRLDSQLRELKQDLDEVVKSKTEDITTTEDMEEFRLEADSLRDELLRLRRELDEVRARRQEDALAVKQAKNAQVTTHWLQKTVEDIRNEMSELAASVNVTASLSQKQKEEAGLTLARSEIADLRKRLDSMYVTQERDNAWVAQLKQDIKEIRQKLQDVSIGHQKLAHEVAELKEELSDRILFDAEKRSHLDDRKLEIPEGHQMRHRGHWKVEVEELKDTMSAVQSHQRKLLHDVRHLKHNNADLTSKVEALEQQGLDLTNRSSYLGVEQKAMSRQVDALQKQTDRTEKRTEDLKSVINNITETGIKKLHASTLQLFKTMETLEDNYDKTIDDIRKEMSKMEFNLAQVQSTASEIREEQTTYDQTLKSMKHDMRRTQMEYKRDRYRLMSLKSDVINKTLQDSLFLNQNSFQELKMSEIDSKISNLAKSVESERAEVDYIQKQISEKADSIDLSRWERTQDRLREVVLNITGIIPRMTKEEENLHKEMDKFVRQLPKDCTLDKATKKNAKSGVYLIQVPHSPSEVHGKATRVFCDMDTAGGGWIVLQRRQDGSQDFNQNWSKYKEGFGDITRDFWFGNELMHLFTTDSEYELRIDLWDSADRYKFVEYKTFRVLEESDGYRLAVAGYSGNGSDAFGYHNGMAFSTPDRDNDASSATHCGQFYGSGWWYNHCQYVNINGRYSTGVTWYDINGKEWSELTKVEMKIRPARAQTRP